MSSEHWHLRPTRCVIGVGSGDRAATFDVVLDVPEWTGPFGSVAEDAARHELRIALVLRQVSLRFAPDEKLQVLKMTPLAKRVRPAWDR